MLLDPNIGALIKSIKARIYGIDLRWLAHAHGAVQNSEGDPRSPGRIRRPLGNPLLARGVATPPDQTRRLLVHDQPDGTDHRQKTGSPTGFTKQQTARQTPSYPEKYSLYAKPLEEHCRLLLQNRGTTCLSTEMLTREEIAKANYNVATDLTRAKVEVGIADPNCLEELKAGTEALEGPIARKEELHPTGGCLKTRLFTLAKIKTAITTRP
jgi:hypothetical protein